MFDAKGCLGTRIDILAPGEISRHHKGNLGTRRDEKLRKNHIFTRDDILAPGQRVLNTRRNTSAPQVKLGYYKDLGVKWNILVPEKELKPRKKIPKY